MRNIIVLSVACLLFCAFSLKREKKLLERFKIGRFEYKVYHEESYVHDENETYRYFVFYRTGQSASMCSAYLYTFKHGAVTFKGTYFYTNQYLECKGVYIGDKTIGDSMMKRYYPNQNGDLKLKEYTVYKNGKAETTAY